MSIQTWIVCDECQEAAVLITSTALEYRAVLKQDGWSRAKGGFDYCMICTALRELEADGFIERVEE